MKIIYQSPNYWPDMITNRYLHISPVSGLPIVSETVKTPQTNYTYRSYILPKKRYKQFEKVIAEAERIKMEFPNAVELEEDPNDSPYEC